MNAPALLEVNWSFFPLPRDGIGSEMDMDIKGCTLEKVASPVLVRVREGPDCLDYLLYFLLFPGLKKGMIF